LVGVKLGGMENGGEKCFLAKPTFCEEGVSPQIVEKMEEKVGLR